MTMLEDGQVIVIGGISATASDERPHSLASVEIYDPGAGTWRAGKDMPTPRSYHGAALLPSGKVLVAGGLNVTCYACPDGTAEIYDPAADSWSTTFPMSFGRGAPATATLSDGRVLFAGGYSSDINSQTTAEVFSEATQSWSLTGPMTHPHNYEDTATLQQDGKVFVLGGTGDTATSDIFDPVGNTWRTGPDPISIRTPSTPYGGFTVTLLNTGKLLVVGEASAADVAVVKSYDPVANTFTDALPTLIVHAGHTATTLPNGTLLIVGGYFSATSEIYDAGDNQWTDSGNMLGTRGSHLAALLRDGSVLVAAGQGLDDGTGGAQLGYLLTTERSAPFPKPIATKYVALGDSYSSGEGIEPFFGAPSNPQPCHRSTLAYPTLVQLPNTSAPLFLLNNNPANNVQWGFQACTGATTADVLKDTHINGEPHGQLNQDRSGDPNPYSLAVDSATTLVTITIGGDDVNFRGALQYCYFKPNCETTIVDGRTYEQSLTKRVDDIRSKLDDVYHRILQQTGHARVLVLGYPQLFPATAKEMTCAKLRESGPVSLQIGHGEPVSFGWSVPEQRMIRRVDDYANNVISDEVSKIGSPWLTFVPVASYFSGHEVCGSKGEWINGPTLTFQHTKPPGNANDQSFHPNDHGQMAYADCVNAALNAPILSSGKPCVRPVF